MKSIHIERGLPLVYSCQVVYVEGKANKQRDYEQTIRNNRWVHVLRRQSKSDECLDLLREHWRIAEVIPCPVEKNMGQPTLVGIRELVAAPLDRLIVSQQSIDQGEDRIEIFVIRAPTIRTLRTAKLLERVASLLSDAFPLNREVYECPSRSVSSVP